MTDLNTALLKSIREITELPHVTAEAKLIGIQTVFIIAENFGSKSDTEEVQS